MTSLIKKPNYRLKEVRICSLKVLLYLFFILLLGVSSISAQSCDREDPREICNPLEFDSFEELITNIINILFYISVVLAPIMILYGGFLLMTGGGDPAKTKTARSVIFYAVIGLAVVFLARVVVYLVRGALGT